MSGEENITNCKFTEREVGKIIKSSKLKFRWDFSIKKVQHYVELHDSRMTAKKKIIIDGSVVFPKQMYKFNYLISSILEL
jgi:hypothetical protein